MTEELLGRRVDVIIPDEDEAPPWYIPPGSYPFRVDKAVLKEGPKADYIEVSLETLDGNNQHKVLTDRWSLAPKAIWRVRTGLKALGLPHKGKITIDLDLMKGRWLQATVEDDEYKGRAKSVVTDVEELPEPPDWEGELDAIKATEEQEDQEGQSGPADDEDLPF